MRMNQPYVRGLICVSPRTCWRMHRFSFDAKVTHAARLASTVGLLEHADLADLTKTLEVKPLENASLSSEEVLVGPLIIPSVI